MKRLLALAFVMVAITLSARADISMPIQDSCYDKLGRGMADVLGSGSEMLDSQYGMIDTEGTTVAFFKGFVVQGVSRMVMDMGQGIFEIATAPFPTPDYESLKMAPYDQPMVINDYPPADLNNWY
jgi:putative exosortase-associated protein (TIGR04073 family)